MTSQSVPGDAWRTIEILVFVTVQGKLKSKVKIRVLPRTKLIELRNHLKALQEHSTLMEYIRTGTKRAIRPLSFDLIPEWRLGKQYPIANLLDILFVFTLY